MPPGKRQKVDAGAGKKRRRRRGEEEADLDAGDDFFLTEAQDGGAAADESDSQDEAPETAEEKRLRLAKSYLQQLRASGAVDDEDERDEDLVLDDAELAQKLRQQAHEAGGYLQRQIADRVRVSETAECSRRVRCHDPAVTALALTHDDCTVFSVGKEGGIVRLDVETGAKSHFYRPARVRGEGSSAGPGGGPDWVKRGPRQVSARALLAAAVSSDGQLLAVGGGDRKVHVWDTRSGALVQSYPGHKDSITGLAFRQATHELYSCALDRSVKLWSLDDRAYVDTLFGHQAEALCIDALRHERCVTGGHDHTCRVWKIPEESQLIYRAGGMAIDCCRYVTGTEWVTGSSDGAVALWSQLKKKPAVVARGAHGAQGGGCGGPEAGWVQSVAVCRGTDLVASGAGDGRVRLWQVERGAASSRGLREVASFAAPGWVNALALASSGRFAVAGLGKEPRLGRWARYPSGTCGLLVQRLELADAATDE